MALPKVRRNADVPNHPQSEARPPQQDSRRGRPVAIDEDGNDGDLGDEADEDADSTDYTRK